MHHIGRWATRVALVSTAVALQVGDGVTATESPTQSVRTTINQVIHILEDESMKQPTRVAERRRRLEQVIAARFSYEEMSKRTLAAQWNRLTEAEQREFVDLFRSFLSDRYADKIEGYGGEDIHYLGERIEGTYVEVRTKIVSDRLEIPMDYRLMTLSAEWRVYDVIIDGVSLVRNYRGQFEKIIRQSSYAELVRRLRERTKDPGAQKELGRLGPVGPWTEVTV